MNRPTEAHNTYSETFMERLTHRNWIVLMLSGIMALARLKKRGIIQHESLNETKEELNSHFRS